MEHTLGRRGRRSLSLRMLEQHSENLSQNNNNNNNNKNVLMVSTVREAREVGENHRQLKRLFELTFGPQNFPLSLNLPGHPSLTPFPMLAYLSHQGTESL